MYLKLHFRGHPPPKTHFLVIHLATAVPASMVRPSSWLQARTTVLGPGSDSPTRVDASTRRHRRGLRRRENTSTQATYSLLLRRPLPPPLRHRRPVVKMPRHRGGEVFRSDRSQCRITASTTLVVREGAVGDALRRIFPEGPVPARDRRAGRPGAM